MGWFRAALRCKGDPDCRQHPDCRPQKREPCQEAAGIAACGGKHGVDGIAGLPRVVIPAPDGPRRCSKMASEAMRLSGSGRRPARHFGQLRGSSRKAPIGCCAELCQRMVHTGDLAGPGPGEIILPGLPAFSSPHQIALICSFEAKRLTAALAINFAKKPRHKRSSPENRNICSGQIPMLVQVLPDPSRRAFQRHRASDGSYPFERHGRAWLGKIGARIPAFGDAETAHRTRK
jgi:hypothetical protein